MDPVLVGLAAGVFVVAIVLAAILCFLGESSRIAWAASLLLDVAANTLIGLGAGDVSIGARF